MKFGDKLIILRKKNGLSQEELAEKLGVSRQSVSKWESNNTYPETDKIVQICNMFDCSMDDLINDKITDVEGALRKNKNNFNEVWDSLLEFITKTINMFSHMRFSQGLKCVIEMGIMAFILWIFGMTICGISSSIIANLFSFFGNKTTLIIETLLNSIFNILWFILSVIALIHTFKIKYLNNYEETIKEETSNKKETNEKNDNKKEKTNIEKTIIREEKEKPFAFLSILSTIILYFIKFLVFWIAFSTIFIIISIAIATIISLSLITTNLLFIGTSISLISSLIISILFILLCIHFIISKKVNIKVFIFTFITSVVLLGVGIGICAISVKNFDIVNYKDNTSEEIAIEYEDNLVITPGEIDDINEYTYIADENIPDNSILLEVKYDKKNKEIQKIKTEEDKLILLKISSEFKIKPKDIYKLIIKDLKENKIVIDHLNSGINGLTIKANSDTINKLLTNTEKLYLLEKETDESTTKVKKHGDKVIIYGGNSFVEYNAINDELIYTEIAPNNFKCGRTVRKTNWGDRIEYNCINQENIDIEEYNEELEE